MKHRLDSEHAMELYNKGLCDKEIAQTIGMTVQTVGDWRRRMGLPANKGKPPVHEISPISRDARAAGGGHLYGKYKAQQFETQVRGRAQIDRLRRGV